MTDGCSSVPTEKSMPRLGWEGVREGGMDREEGKGGQGGREGEEGKGGQGWRDGQEEMGCSP